ncbi:hypothetical protein [Nocardia donostiensis]|uniref:Uncharacterized protein n=1 Tax=Nocardia donostiensis TaxID=1538463 RepID=A0A1V2TFL8_9NOCA|nr:hypothetical protein [Nocardia donostiensis]ONM48295.1 hypothetical protein B0T46_13000 [Nocardia donostiensis]OQS20595.1 hypothetical protein B0T44_09980 [Nocardia donostiensis]
MRGPGEIASPDTEATPRGAWTAGTARPPHSTIRATAEYGSKFRFFVSLLGKPCRYGEPVVGLKFVSNPATGTHQGYTRLTGVQP